VRRMEIKKEDLCIKGKKRNELEHLTIRSTRVPGEVWREETKIRGRSARLKSILDVGEERGGSSVIVRRQTGGQAHKPESN